MELVSNDIQIPEEEREVLSANIISLKKDNSQLSIPPIDENEKESRIILTAIDEFKEKEMEIFNNEQLNENFNIFEKSRWFELGQYNQFHHLNAFGLPLQTM